MLLIISLCYSDKKMRIFCHSNLLAKPKIPVGLNSAETLLAQSRNGKCSHRPKGAPYTDHRAQRPQTTGRGRGASASACACACVGSSCLHVYCIPSSAICLYTKHVLRYFLLHKVISGRHNYHFTTQSVLYRSPHFQVIRMLCCILLRMLQKWQNCG